MDNLKAIDLIFSVAEQFDDNKFSEIIKRLETFKKPIDQDTKDALAMVIEQWRLNPDESPKATEFIVELSRFFNKDFPELKTVLPPAVKKLLPKGINKSTAIKALGIRSEDVALYDFYVRFRKLLYLKPENFYYSRISNKWGILKNIDWITGSAKIYCLIDSKMQEVELEKLLKNFLIFEANENLEKVLNGKIDYSYKQIAEIVYTSSATHIGDEQIYRMLFSLYVPNKMRRETFEKWCSSKEDKNKKSQGISQARSIKELNIILKKHSSDEINDEDIPHLKRIFNLAKSYNSDEELQLWAETLCLIMNKLTEQNLRNILPTDEGFINKVWPKIEENNKDTAFYIWGRMKSGQLYKWAEITKMVRGETYLMEIALELPWRAWPAITSKIHLDSFVEKLKQLNKITSPEALLWIWKNKNKKASELLGKINSSSFFTALSLRRKGSIGNFAINELKKLITNNSECQQIVIGENNEANIAEFLERLNYSPAFTSAEKQALIVKLSRINSLFKKLFERNKTKYISSEDKEKEDTETGETHITSIRAYNEKVKELNDIINRQLPENTKAIATAREHGDLRENAEYAAAKENQKMLNEQRGTLEKQIATTQPTDFLDIEVKDKVVVGCAVELEYQDKTNETVYILGFWDSDPGKKFISYESAFGKSLIAKSVNSVVEVPGKTKCKIKSIKSLPEEVRKYLAAEE